MIQQLARFGRRNLEPQDRSSAASAKPHTSCRFVAGGADALGVTEDLVAEDLGVDAEVFGVAPSGLDT